MPILRHTSSTLVPRSFCFHAKAIWSSVNLLFLTTCSWSLQAFIMPVISVTERFRLLGQGHPLPERRKRAPRCRDRARPTTSSSGCSGFQGTQPLHINRRQLTEVLAPGIDRLLAELVLLGRLRPLCRGRPPSGWPSLGMTWRESCPVAPRPRPRAS